MLLGKPPFKAATEYLTFQLISAGQLDLPASVPANAQDLLRRLLTPDASQRIGQAQSHMLVRLCLPSHARIGQAAGHMLVCLCPLM